MAITDNKKILILANDSCGLYKFRVELVERLIKEGYNVYIASPYSSFVSNFIDLGCCYIEVNLNRRGKNLFQDLKLFARYVKIIKKIKPQAVLTYTIKPNIYGSLACILTKVPCIANVTGLGTALENGGLLKKIIISLYKIAFAKIKRVFVQNEENYQYFVNNNISVNKLKLIPGSGVNLEYYKPLAYPKENINLEFTFISRIIKEKGIDEYLDAAKTIKERYPNIVFHVYGYLEPDYQGKLKEYNEEKIVKYHGAVEDLHEIYERVNCVVHPTYYPEGMSNVLLEASACARPIITTDRAGCREIIDDGINGFIVEQKNSQDLIEKIEKFIVLPYQRKVKMGLAGRKKVETSFDRQIVVNAYLQEIKEL